MLRDQMVEVEHTVTDRVGQQFGNYQLVKLLGQGSFAEVYLGKHRYLNSYAALKVSQAKINRVEEQKVLAEAQTLVELRHSNIVHLLDFAIENGTPMLIMDYAPKGSLRQHYPNGTQIPLKTVVDFVTQIAAALQYAHNHNVIHRDVKPENILLDADNRLLLSDFGLSLLTPSPQQLSTQDPAGTPCYIAPEQLRGKPCFASDQYALAIMIYEWLCGEHPFHGNMWEIWQQHLYTDPPPLRPIRPELPLTFEQVVLRALAKKPQDRFVSIQAFAQALARASQTSTPIEENVSQVTAPLQAIVPLSPIALPLQKNQIAEISTLAQAKDQSEAPRASASQNRARMIRRLRRSYSDLMSQSLQGVAWLELGIATKPDAVQNATHLLLHISSRAAQHLPSGTSIKEAYDEAEHELLILGEPGAGKSTLLLDLAQKLLVQAEQDQTHPLPVILPLSSWAVKRPKLEDWIAEQLAQIYGVPRKLSLQWAGENGILPLLDGLDEMEETARSACIATINTYHREHLAPLVVCSRTTEYEAAASQHRLALQGAVIVQPLTHEDVDAYLVRAGKPLTALRDALKKNAALHDLATTPLMLNILILTYQETSVGSLSSSESHLLQEVWDDYVQRMAERRGNRKRYPLEQTCSWLGWQARQMREHNQTVFYLEQVQPDWLTDRQRQAYKWLGVRLPAIIIGVLLSILIGPLFLNIQDWQNLLQIVTFGGVLGGLLRPTVSSDTAHSAAQTRRQRRIALSISIGVGSVIAFSQGWGYDTTLQGWLLDGCIYGVTIGLSCFLLQHILSSPPRSTSPTFLPSSGRWVVLKGFVQQRHLQLALLVALLIWLSVGLSIGLSYPLKYGYELSIGVGYGTSVGLIYGLNFGLIVGLISVTLERLQEGIHLTERVSFSWRNLRNHLFASTHIRFALMLAGCIIVFVELIDVLSFGRAVRLSNGLRHGLSTALIYGLSLGLLYWLLLGFYQSIAQERIEDQDRRVPNQGIRQSLRNSLLLGLISGTTSGTIIGGMGILTFGLSFGLSNFWPLFVTSGLLFWVITGGLAIWRHYLIRFLLQCTQTFPWNAFQFLDDATARILLRRIGGGYSFTHRLLLDHFADLEAGAAPDTNGSPTVLPHSEQ
jgi:serine/threonine protein kinase